MSTTIKAALPKRSRQKKVNANHFPVCNPDTAGIDIGAEEHYVGVPADRDPEPVRCFSAFTEGLHALIAWLKACRIRSVAVEATGVYWIPLYQLLEAQGFAVCLVNARHLQNVTGRKTDVCDCQWLQYLHAVGLLNASFRPNEEICAVRTVLRYRDTLVTQGATQIQHMQKALTQMNLHLHHVLADISGVSGMRIIEAIVAGERDPELLAELRDRRVKASQETVVAAWRGDWREEHRFVLRQAWELYRHYQSKLPDCDREVERLLAKFDNQAAPQAAPPPPKNAPRQKARKNEIRLPETNLRVEMFRLWGTDLTHVPGLGPSTLANLYSELGPAFPTAFEVDGRFTSWLGLSPEPKKTGGKVVRDRTRPLAHRVAKMFRIAAQSLHHDKSAWGDFFRRMKARLGTKGAITATANKLARIFFRLVKTKDAYAESIYAAIEAKQDEKRLKWMRKQAERLGFNLVPQEVVS